MPALEGQLSTATQQVATLHSAERELKRQVMDLEVGIEQARAQAAELEGAQLDNKTTRGELESLLKSLTERASHAEAEALRLREARLAEQETLAELRSQNTLLEARLAEASRAAPQTDAAVTVLRRRIPELEAELEITRVNATAEVETARTAQQQAEEMLLALRVKYGDLQHQATQANEDLTEARAEAELLEQERERLATQLEAMEKAAKELQPFVPASPVVPPLGDAPPVEVFEIEIADDDQAEEIVLLEDEATDPGRKR